MSRPTRHPSSGTTKRSIRVGAAIATLSVVMVGCSDDSGSDQDGASGTGAGTDSAPEAEAEAEAEDSTASAQLNDAADAVTVAGSGEEGSGSVSVDASRALFASAPAVVVASAGDAAGIDEGAESAESLGVPLLLLSEPAPATGDMASSTTEDGATSTAGDGAQSTADTAASTGDQSSATAPPSDNGNTAQIEEITRLGAEQVLAVGEGTESALGEVDDVDVVTGADDIEDVVPASGLTSTAVLVDSDGGDPTQAATATATAAGATVVPIQGGDLRNDAEAITALADANPDSVVAVGPEFGDADTLTGRIDVAKTGVQLPGGGQALFPGRLLVALYGTPGTPGLGVLGEQDLDASIARAKEVAADYEDLTDVPVVPTFEIIATIAQASAGADGDYSGEIAVKELRPWVEKAGEEGVYVVLDLQPGRANFLDQAKIYEELLTYPHVGLALDPEWRLTPTQRPLQQIGQVEADEVNTVLDWLADLTQKEKLPQKLVVLHQFRLTMLQDQDQIDMSRDELQVLVHMDGQGSPDLKDGTWQSVVDNAREGMPFGWKNFYDEDEPMLTPEQTMEKEPTPVMISYQ